MLLREVRSKLQLNQQLKMKGNSKKRLKVFSLTISQGVKAATKLLSPSNDLVLESRALLESRVHLGLATVILMERTSPITMKRLQQVEVSSAAQARTASLETVFWEEPISTEEIRVEAISADAAMLAEPVSKPTIDF